MEKTIEIPEGYKARIDGNKVIIEPKESEDERIIGRIKKAVESYWSDEPLDEILAWLEKQGSQNLANSAKTCKDEQNPAWSKKDEYILEILTSVLQVNFEPNERFSGYEEYMNVDLINWLKSLKERYTWKPSDEQIHYLSWIANVKLGDDVVEQEVSKHLNELYDDLKKLKG